MFVLDCIIIGGGPAGLSASLTLGRARRNIVLFDDGTNRNKVTQEAHGFITRDGIKPQEFKDIGLKELEKYPNVTYVNSTIQEVVKDSNGNFIVQTINGQKYRSEKLLLATGMQEVFPIESIKEYYGKSLFSCPYCDGWELKDQPLIILAEKEEHVLHLTKIVYNWSKNLIVLTHGGELSEECMRELQERNIEIRLEVIKRLIGEDGYLQAIELESGETIYRSAGFVVPTYFRPNYFAEQLGCELKETGTIITKPGCRTTQKNIYIAGETRKTIPTSLLISAAEGNNAAVSINTDLSMERF